MRVAVSVVAGIAVAAGSWAGRAAADSAAVGPVLRTAVTQHEILVGPIAVRYTATVREFPVKDRSGTVGASVVTIAYTRDGVRDRAHRPLIFAFNGGPGASSSPLHMKALGPVVRTKDPVDGSDSKLLANAFSVLDCADLVFIDPVSTGFSRPWPGVDPQPWYDNVFDAQSVADVIAQWLHANRRESSPRFLMGESYGTMRAGIIVRRVPGLHFDGVLLVSGPGVPDDAPADTRFVGAVPSMAAGAWYHERVDRRGLTSAEFFREALAFARGPYAEALARGASLGTEERQRVATQLASFIGLPVDLIMAHDLRIDANTWMFNLLKDQGLRTGRLDVRVTGPLAPGQEGAIDDPALGVVKRGQSPGPAPTPASIGAVPSPVVGRYLVETLKFPSVDVYVGVNFLANSKWTFQPDPGTEANLAAAMARDRHLRLFVTSGYFDYGASDGQRFLGAGVPEDRFTFVPLPGPHEVYAGEENRAAFNAAVRRFVTAAGNQAH